MNAFCLTCKTKSTCVKICPRLEKTLPKEQSGKLWGETIVSNDMFDTDAFTMHRRGKRIHPVRYNDDYEVV